MTKIKNIPRKNLSLLKSIRGQLEQRAIWLALLSEEAEKKGLPTEDFAAAAISRCGDMQGAELSNGSNSFLDLKKRLFSWGARQVFEMEILEADKDKLSIDFHYCPLVAGWVKMGLSDEKIAKFCDIAMCGDRHIARQFGGELKLGKLISEGADVCELRFVKNTEKN